MNKSKFEDPFVIKVNVTDQPEAEQPSGVQIVRATGKEDSDDGSSDEHHHTKGKKPVAAKSNAPKGMSEVKEATQESSPELPKRGGLANPTTRQAPGARASIN